MKKLKFIALTSLLFLTLNSFGQVQQLPASAGEGTLTNLSRSGELDPPANAIFSQQPVGSTTAIFSDEGTTYGSQTIYEDFQGLTTDIGGIVFWGVFYDNGECYTPGASYDFDINFYQDNAGAVGTLVSTFTTTITPIPTGSSINGSIEILRFEVTFPSGVSLQNGWVSVVRKNPTNLPCSFAWANTTLGNNNFAYTQGSSGIYYNTSGLNASFCLTAQPPVPVSNWALIFGIFLIGLFIVVRYKRRLA